MNGCHVSSCLPVDGPITGGASKWGSFKAAVYGIITPNPLVRSGFPVSVCA